jgi:hypothetical protein
LVFEGDRIPSISLDSECVLFLFVLGEMLVDEFEAPVVDEVEEVDDVLDDDEDEEVACVVGKLLAVVLLNALSR